MSTSLLQRVLRHAEGLSAGPSSDGDAELLARFAEARDEHAFGELLRRHGPMVWAVCRQSLLDDADVEDAFQATFLSLIRSAASVRNGAAVAGWLHGVAVRVVLKVKRSAARRRRHEHAAAESEVDRPIPSATWDALLAAVHEEVGRLPETMRTAFVLCELEGVRQPEAADHLGWKLGTLTSRLTRARQLLIDRLSRRGLVPVVAGCSLGLSAATASAAVPPRLLDKTLTLLNAAETVSPAIANLVNEVTPMTAIRMQVMAATIALAAAVGAVMFPASGAQPPAPQPLPAPVERTVAVAEVPKLPAELRYVPSDAAVFVHLEAAKLWSGSLGKSLRDADARAYTEFCTASKNFFGVTPDALQSVTLFSPMIKQGEPGLGIVLVFTEPFDKAKLKAGFESQLLNSAKFSIEAPTDRMAVVLVELDPKTYGQPQPAGKKGPLAEAIREAGTGKHVLVAGSTLANMPDELRGDNLPELFRAYKSLFEAETISALIDLDKDLAVELRVKASTPPKAKEAEKSLSVLTAFVQELIGQGLRETAKEPALKEMVKIMEGMQAGLKEAKYATDGETARVTAKIPGDLPFALAFIAAKRKVSDSASRSQSSNNLKQIAIAMHTYHDAMGSLPPAAVCDKTGKPLLSWRVLILPYLEQNALYKEFKLDEPWDSEHNKKLIAKMPKTYSIPFPTGAKAGETHYRVFVGGDAAFDYLKGSKFNDFTDGLSNTILMATAKDAVPWTKPDELTFDPDKDMTKLLGFFPGDVCLVGFADGSVRALSKTITKKTLHGTITKGGGEVVDPNE